VRLVERQEEVSNLLIDFEFEPHSALYDIINQGMETGFILGGNNDIESLERLKLMELDVER